MNYTTIFEKIICLFEVISNSWLYIAFIGIVALLLLLLVFKKISKKCCFILSLIACFSVFGYTLHQYYEAICKMMDSLMDHLFTDIYFPSAYAYLFILIIINIVTIVSLLNPRGEKVYKTIHGICFVSINFILTIILEMISKNEIDIFKKESLYSNTDFVVLLEFSMNIFILWCLSLFTIYIINMITERIIVAKENKILEKDKENTNHLKVNLATEQLEEEYLGDTSKKEDMTSVIPNGNSLEIDSTRNHFIPSFQNISNIKQENTDSYSTTPNYNYYVNDFGAMQPQNQYEKNSAYNSNINQEFITESTFDLSSFIPRKPEINPDQNLNTNRNTSEIFEKILRNELPVIHQESNVEKTKIEAEKDTYTLNDYRIFNKMLKDIREHNQNNSIHIDKDLEYRLITKYSTETYNMFKKMLKIYSN